MRQPAPPSQARCRTAGRNRAQAADGDTRAARRQINELGTMRFPEPEFSRRGTRSSQQPQEAIAGARDNACSFLYSQIPLRDHPGWTTVYARRYGSPDALKAWAMKGSRRKIRCARHTGLYRSGKKGSDIREHFEHPPYGWSRDAVDGAVQVLLIGGFIRAQDEHGHVADPKELERKALGKTLLKVESATVSTPQRIQIRKMFQKMGCHAKQGEELAMAQQFLQKMQDLADRAGGAEPKPAPPDTTTLDEIRLTAGNEQLLALYNQREEIGSGIDTWSDLASRVEQRWPSWTILKRLVKHAEGLKDVDVIQAQVGHIVQQRLLLEDPDPIGPLVSSLTQLLRDELNRLDQEYQSGTKQGMERLKAMPTGISSSPSRSTSSYRSSLSTRLPGPRWMSRAPVTYSQPWTTSLLPCFPTVSQLCLPGLTMLW